MTKEEKIQESYGEYWDLVKDHLDENGWCGKRKRIKFEELKKSFDIQYDLFNFYWFRPKSLDGIEYNNEWIKVESELDLPKERGTFWTFIEGKEVIMNTFNTFDDMEFTFYNEKVTHYQKIIEPKHPIY